MKSLILSFFLFLLIKNTGAQFPPGDYFNPDVTINSRDGFVWDIVNATFNSGEPIMLGDRPLREVDYQLTVLQDLVVIDYLDVLIDPENFFRVEYILTNGSIVPGFLNILTVPLQPTYRVHQDGTAVNIFAEDLAVNGEIQYGYYYSDNLIIRRSITEKEYFITTEIFNRENEVIRRTEERWDIRTGLRNYFESKSFSTQSHTLWILKGYDPNISKDGSDETSLDTSQGVILGFAGIFVLTVIERWRTIS